MVKIVASNLSNKTILTSIRFVLIMGQCFGLFPLNGITKTNGDDLKFQWISFKCLYTFCNLIFTNFMIIMGTLFLFQIDFRLPQFVEHIFYIRALLTTICFVHLARNWPKLMKEWISVDLIMSNKYGYPKRLDRKLKIGSFVVILLAIIEYHLSIAFHVTDTKRKCGTLNITLYYTKVFPQVFSHMDYRTYLAILIQTASVISTFSWTYLDLLIMLLSISLAVRFKQITRRLKTFEVKTMTNVIFWQDIRQDYGKLANLSMILEEKLSLIVWLSFATNLFFILIQLFYSLKAIKDTIEKVYFYYSFGFLIFRTIAVSLYAASINEESKGPISILTSVPSNLYNNEINRLLLQISFDDVALSGSKMFKVTRGLILRVAGAIVTYELVLIQFLTNN